MIRVQQSAPSYTMRALVLLAAVAAEFVTPSRGATQTRLQDTVWLRRVIVTATRLPTPQSRVPATVTVLDGEELRARGVTRVADALRSVPGLALVQTGSFGGTTSLFARGGNSNYVKVLIDGVAVNSPGGTVDFANLTTENVDRIEILRGPASVLYGSDAVSGVVHIVTRGGGPRLGRVVARGGSYGTRDGVAELSGSAPYVRYSAAASSSRTDGTLPFNNEYRNDAINAQVHLGASGESDARITAKYSDARYHFPTNGSGRVVDRNAYRDEDRLVLGVDVGRRFGERTEVRAVLGSSAQDGISSNRPDGPGDTTGFYATDELSAKRRSAELRLNYSLAEATTFTAGAELLRQRVESDGTSQFATSPPSSTTFDERRLNRALFAQLVRAHEEFSYSLGARVDDNDRFGSFGTVRAAVSYAARGGTRVRAAVGNAFREPAFEETFSTAFTIGNASLDPERTVSWDAAIEQRVARDRIVLAATYFDQRFRDLIQYESGTASTNFRGTYLNLAAARARGVELEVRAPSVGGFGAGASYTVLSTSVTDAGNGAFDTFVRGERLLRRPAHAATIDVAYAAGTRLALSAVAHVVGRRDDRDFANNKRVELPSYYTVDFSADWTLIASTRSTPSLGLTLRAANLFDRDYSPVLNFPAPGRTVLAGVRLEMGNRDRR